MDAAKNLSVLLLLLLGLVSVVAKSSSYDKDFEQCESVVQNWAFSSLEEEVKEDKHTLRNLLFFLHIPRTGGRSYFHCFLRKLYPGSLECPRSYDKLRFDPRKKKCRLLVTHDDYSLISKFPKQKTSVVTILRDPIDRVFSAYEFSIEVAARFLIHPNLTSATSSIMAGLLRAKSKGVKGVSTLDIWPWKYLVPWIREDLFTRREATKIKGNKSIIRSDPYDMSEVVMPLGEYIQEPIVHEIVHNGATFQVAGLTNNSYTSESHEVRHCVQKYEVLGDHVLQVAKKRLDDMLYVGLTEEHRESATMFANVVGSQVISQLRALNPSTSDANGRKTELSSLGSDSKSDNDSHQKSSSYQNSSDISSSQTETNEEINQNMTVEELMDSYGQCISNLRKTQAQRRVLSLKKISPANFTKEARRRVSENVIQQILSLNHLDVELYKHAQLIFAKQHTRSSSNFAAMERLDNMLKSSTGIVSWKFITIGTIILLAASGLLVNVRRRTSSKVKI